MSTVDPSTVATIVTTAQAIGVDPLTALADSYQESGVNPTAVGDAGTSFGLYQLHQGGELGSLSPQAAFNPATNAGVALGQFAAVAKTNPSLTPGALAAAAEQPASPGPYAADVNAYYSQLATGAGEPPPPSSSGFSSWLSKAVSTIGHLGKGAGDAATGNLPAAASQGAQAAAGVLGVSGLAGDVLHVALVVVFVVGGLALVGLGLARMFPGVTRTVMSTAAVTAAA